MKFKAFGKTDVGIKRTNNEDAFFIANESDYADKIKDEGLLLIVADGMGGHKGGEVASFMAVQTISEYYYTHTTESIRERIINAIKLANIKIYKEGARKVELENMGTTIVVAVLKGNKLYVANVGDSRCYLIRENRIMQITEDHSLVAELVKQGLITKEEAKNNPQKNVITRSVGIKQTVRPQFYTELLMPGDYILLCTDGLSGVLGEKEILNTVISNPLPEVVDQLIKKTLDNGAPDNVTVVLAKVLPSENKNSGNKNKSISISINKVSKNPISNKILTATTILLLIAFLGALAFSFYINNSISSYKKSLSKIASALNIQNESSDSPDSIVKSIENEIDKNKKSIKNLNDELKDLKDLNEKTLETINSINDFVEIPLSDGLKPYKSNENFFINVAKGKLSFAPYGISKNDDGTFTIKDIKGKEIKLTKEYTPNNILTSEDGNLYFYCLDKNNKKELYYVSNGQIPNTENLFSAHAINEIKPVLLKIGTNESNIISVYQNGGNILYVENDNNQYKLYSKNSKNIPISPLFTKPTEETKSAGIINYEGKILFWLFTQNKSTDGNLVYFALNLYNSTGKPTNVQIELPVSKNYEYALFSNESKIYLLTTINTSANKKSKLVLISDITSIIKEALNENKQK